MHRPTQISFASLYSSKFILLGVQLPFLSGWLALQGFTAGEIGLVTGAALAARLALGPFVAWWADHQTDARSALRLVAFVFAFSALALAAAPGKAAIAASAIVLLWSFGVLVPLTDSAALRADRLGLLHFGQTRAIGSFAFLATNLLGGEALTRMGFGASVTIMAAAGAATLAVALMLPRIDDPRAARGAPRWSDAPRLLGEPRFALALFASGLTQGAHAVYYAFSVLHWSALGYSPRVIGALWATGVIAEIVFLMRVRTVLRRLRPEFLIALGGAGAALRWLVTAAEPPLGLLFVVQTLHALSFAATYIGMIEFIDRAVPKRLANTAMTLNSTLGVGALTGLATVVAGFVFESEGAGAAYVMMAAMAAGAGALALLLSRAWRGEKLFE